jgi:membrane protein insertase Oxa1/YidC/SpoIIIJ
MQQTTGTSAIASLVLGIVALATLLTAGVFYGCLPLPLILGILAWIFGKNAMNAIDAGVGNPNERGMAVAGYIMGIISVVLSVLGLCCVGGALAGIIGIGAAPLWELQQLGF